MISLGTSAQDVEAAAARFAKDHPTVGVTALEAAMKPVNGARDVAVVVSATQPVNEAETSVVEEAFSRCLSLYCLSQQCPKCFLRKLVSRTFENL